MSVSAESAAAPMRVCPSTIGAGVAANVVALPRSSDIAVAPVLVTAFPSTE